MRLASSRLVFAAVAILVGSSLTAPISGQSWVRSPINGHEYLLTASMNWHAARAEAQRLGGELATIRSQAEQDWIHATFGSGRNLWMGFTDEGTEGQWRWASGESVRYTNWAPGEPNNLGGEHWAHFRTPDGRWNDASNVGDYYGLVERAVRHVTFPLDAVTAEGAAGYPGLFAAPRARTQTVMTAAGFSANTPGNVTALSWRRDRGTQVYSARRVDLAIRVGTPTTNPYGMSSTFAQNHSAPLQEAFRGFVDVPEAQPELTGPALFTVRVPLSTPWAWSGGDALLEVEVFSNSVSGLGGWEVDMQARQRGAGTVTPLGTGCASSWGAPLLDAPDPRDLIPGGRIDQRLRMAPPGAIAAAWFGNRTDEWSGVPLPFTFPSSACTIYTNNMVGVLLPVFADGATALLSVPLPADSIVNGLTAYSQWGVLEPFAYPPITTTRALALTAAAAPSVWFDTIANLDGSATGLRFPDSYAAPVVQLEVR